jgi:dTDP-4-amino-4,6-dideoxygalactose transaminase
MDCGKIEERITKHTRAILVCHWGGQAANLDQIMEIARKHNLAVCEDSYQAMFAQWRGKQLGGIGDIGVLGHHQSEILPCAEGASLIGNNEEVMSRCYAWGDFGRDVNWATHRPLTGAWPHLGRNLKVTEMQGALLMAGLQRVSHWAQRRVENAAYLKKLISDIPGIEPQREYEGQTRGGYLWFMMRYDKRHFSNLPLDKFVAAVREEGVMLSRGMTRPLTEEPYIERILQSRHMKYVFSQKRLDFMRESLHCPAARRAASEENCGIHGQQMQSSKSDMDAIAAALRKIHKYSEQIRRS